MVSLLAGKSLISFVLADKQPMTTTD